MELITKQIRKVIVGALLCYPVISNAEVVVLESITGESFAFEINENDTFLNVMDSIEAIARHADNHEQLNFSFMMLSKNISLNDILAKKAMVEPRSYAYGIKASECADITYIVKTMANSSLPKIKIAESSLKKAGERIDHLHPFYFLSCIFTNEELKVCMRNLQGRAWVWKEFLKGIVTSLEEENGKGNVLPYAADFAERVKVDINVILPILQGGRWERFVDTLIDKVPREGGSDRYNM